MIPPEAAAKVLGERLAEAKTPLDQWRIFKAFAGEPLQGVDATRDEDLLLYETAARGGRFALSFKRQVFDADGNQFPTAALSIVVPSTPPLESVKQTALFAPGGPPWTDEMLRRAQRDSNHPLDQAARGAAGWVEQVESHPAFRLVVGT